MLAHAEPLAALIERVPADRPRRSIRRAVELPAAAAPATHLGVTVSPLGDDASAPHGVICLFTDLTAVVALEEQLRLKDSLARVGELTAGIAHEFRNGLATIHGYSRLLDLDALPPAFRPYVEGIRAETESLREVVTNFLNFARPTQLDAVAGRSAAPSRERAADDLRADARALGGDIAVRGEFATIDGDDVLLRQAFSNLLRNAIEACAAASVAPAVTVDRAGRSRAGRLHASSSRQRSRVSRGRARTRLPSVLHDEARRAPDSASRWSRRSSSRTTGA